MMSIKRRWQKCFFAHASDGKLAKKQGVEELLKYLKDKGFKVGIASSTREKIVRRQISEGDCWNILIRSLEEIW